MTTKGWSQPWSTWRKDEGDSSDESDWTFDNPGGKRGGGEDVPARETCADPDLMFNNMKNDRKDDEDL